MVVNVEIMITLVGATKRKGNPNWCKKKPQYLLDDFFSIDMEMGPEPLIKVEPYRAKENMEFKVETDCVGHVLAPKYQNHVTNSVSMEKPESLQLKGFCSLQVPEINGKELKVKLDKDGVLGGFEYSSGKEVDLVSFASQDVDATVIIPSEKESKIVGKISRRVSLVRYPEPKELLETTKAQTQQKLLGAVTNTSGKHSNPARSSLHKSGQSALRHSASTRSSRQKSIFSGFTESPMYPKRKRSEPSSGKHHGPTTTASGSSDRSGKSKKKVKTEK